MDQKIIDLYDRFTHGGISRRFSNFQNSVSCSRLN